MLIFHAKLFGCGKSYNYKRYETFYIPIPEIHMLVYSSQQIISWRLQAVCYRIDLNDAIRLIYLCIVYTFSKIFFTCNYPGNTGIMTKESCLIYVL